MRISSLLAINHHTARHANFCLHSRHSATVNNLSTQLILSNYHQIVKSQHLLFPSNASQRKEKIIRLLANADNNNNNKNKMDLYNKVLSSLRNWVFVAKRIPILQRSYIINSPLFWGTFLLNPLYLNLLLI